MQMSTITVVKPASCSIVHCLEWLPSFWGQRPVFWQGGSPLE